MARGFDEVLIVELAGQRFGLPGEIVRELLRAVLITPVARPGSFVEGVVSIRGKIVPVLDLRQWLALPAKPVEPSDHFVVISTGRQEAVVRVDRAVELTRMPASSLDQTELGRRDQPGLDAAGKVAQFAGELVLVPDLGRFFAEQPAAAPASGEGLQP